MNAKSFLKFFAALGAVGVVIAGGFYVYELEQVKQRKLKKDEILSFESDKPWSWHNEDYQVQSRYLPEQKKTVLRQVSEDKSYIVYAVKNDQYQLNTMLRFVTTCTPKSIIETSKKWDDGKPKTLTCSNDGTYLFHDVIWTSELLPTGWAEQLDGFNFYVQFEGFDFALLDREVTLTKAKKSQEDDVKNTK